MLAIQLRDRLPFAEIEVITAESERQFGGHLSCAHVDGYVIEHGFHTLFEFYDEALAMLERVGAGVNFRRSADMVWIHDRGRLHRCSPRSLAVYSGASWAEKRSMLRLWPTIREAQRQVRRHGLRWLDQLDDLDFRGFLRREGLSPSFAERDMLRMFYDFGFNGRRQMSAAVGMKVLLSLIEKPTLRHFLAPADEALMRPLRDYARDRCRVRVRHDLRLTGLELAQHGARIEALQLESRSGPRREEVDMLVLALDLESLRALDAHGVRAGDVRVRLFPELDELESVSSLSLQAWFDEDPVPAKIDNVIGGLPGPLSTLCPVTRVRGEAGPFELIAVGPEADAADLDDAQIIAQFWQTLRRLGFRVGSVESARHVHLHRNGEGGQRYLLTSPGGLRSRPGVATKLDNLFLAGAWLDVPLSIPSVEAAAQSARLAAEAVGEALMTNRSPLVIGMPARHPLCLPTPYRKHRVRGSFFILDAGRPVAHELPPCLEPAPGFEAKLLWAMLDYREVWSRSDPSGARYSFKELVVNAIVRERDAPTRFGLHPLAIYINSDVAVAVGREMYGFPKKLAEIRHEPGSVSSFSVVRAGLRRSDPPGPVYPIPLFEGSWRCHARADEPHETEHRAFGAFTRVSDALFRSVIELPFYLHQVIPDPDWTPRVALSRVLCAPLIDLEVHETFRLSDGRFTIGDSQVDPLDELVPGRGPLLAAHGLCVDMSFGMAVARVVADYSPKARAIHTEPRFEAQPVAIAHGG